MLPNIRVFFHTKQKSDNIIQEKDTTDETVETTAILDTAPSVIVPKKPLNSLESVLGQHQHNTPPTHKGAFDCIVPNCKRTFDDKCMDCHKAFCEPCLENHSCIHDSVDINEEGI